MHGVCASTCLEPYGLLLLPTDVPMWLKSLRLHKYQHLFAELGYEEMLQISEDYLEEKVCVYMCVCVWKRRASSPN